VQLSRHSGCLSKRLRNCLHFKLCWGSSFPNPPFRSASFTNSTRWSATFAYPAYRRQRWLLFHVKVGDALIAAKRQPTGTKVVSIRKIHRDGLYAPFTVSGDVVVNGVAPSSYIALPPAFQSNLSFEQQHWMQHAAYAPCRLYCGLVGGCENETYDEATGLSKGPTVWLPLLHWLEDHSQVVLPTFLFLVAVPGQWALLMIEQAVFNAAYIAAVVLRYWVWKK